MKKIFAASSALAAGCLSLMGAGLQPDPLFSDHTVLQHGVVVPVWGLAPPGEEVAVFFMGYQQSATANAEGEWQIELPPLPPGGPYEMTIAGAGESLTIGDVLVGEVWLCSGQSNMARTVVPPPQVEPRFDYWEEAAASADYPQIREFKVRGRVADEPHALSTGEWEVCTPENARGFSAVGYFFARDLSAARGDVPVGIITAAVGATDIANWMSLEALNDEPELDKHMAYMARHYAKYPVALEKYEADLAEYEVALKAYEANGGEEPKKPREPQDPAKNPYRMSANYNGKIAPLIPYAIKGVLWYQGEQNRNRRSLYPYFLRGLIRSWREAWDQGDFPFIVIQLPDHKGTEAAFRVAQQVGAEFEPNTAIVVTMDVGDPEDIHPPNKEPVGVRSALAARALAYGEPIQGYSPRLVAVDTDGAEVTLRFSDAEGLRTAGGPAKGFELAGADQQFVPASARIDESRVILTADGIAEPEHVRYAWSNVPEVNIYNSSDLPIAPFRHSIE